MRTTPALLDSFLAVLRAAEGEQLADEPGLGEALAALGSAARAGYPDFDCPLEGFVAYVAERVLRTAGSCPVVRALGELPAADLYLAYGCLRGEGAALAAFAVMSMTEVRWALKRLRLPMAEEDLQQMVLLRLLMASEQGQPPRLSQYAGKSRLATWVRVVATREALMQQRKERPPGQERDLGEALSVSASAPELEFFKNRYREELRESFGWALKELNARQRNLLRHQVLHGRTIDDLAALYRVNRTTASRWLDKTRQVLFTTTRAHMMKRLRVPQDEFHSILRLLHSQLDERLIHSLAPALEAEAPSLASSA